MTLQLTSAQLFIGAGGKFTAGVIDTSEAIGFSASTGLSLAVLTVGTTKYTGLELTQLSASLVDYHWFGCVVDADDGAGQQGDAAGRHQAQLGRLRQRPGVAAAAQLHGQHEQLR